MVSKNSFTLFIIIKVAVVIAILTFIIVMNNSPDIMIENPDRILDEPLAKPVTEFCRIYPNAESCN